MRLRAEPLLRGRQQPRLADPRLAREQDHPALATLGLLPAPQQQLHLLLAPDQRRQGRRVERLEPARCRADAEDAVRPDRPGEALGLDGTEVGAREQAADELARAFGDDDAVRLGDPLQPARPGSGSRRRPPAPARRRCRAGRRRRPARSRCRPGRGARFRPAPRGRAPPPRARARRGSPARRRPPAPAGSRNRPGPRRPGTWRRSRRAVRCPWRRSGGRRRSARAGPPGRAGRRARSSRPGRRTSP